MRINIVEATIFSSQILNILNTNVFKNDVQLLNILLLFLELIFKN
jgi:hypothetical protein